MDIKLFIADRNYISTYAALKQSIVNKYCDIVFVDIEMLHMSVSDGVTTSIFQTDLIHLSNVGSMLDHQRCRRWTNIKPTLNQYYVFEFLCLTV